MTTLPIKYYRRPNCPKDLDEAMARLEKAEHALVNAKTADEVEIWMEASENARKEVGQILLRLDRVERPHIYRKSATVELPDDQPGQRAATSPIELKPGWLINDVRKAGRRLREWQKQRGPA